jgi:hypothetical protein
VDDLAEGQLQPCQPCESRFGESTKDCYWSRFRSFYSQVDEPLAVDHDLAREDDAEKLSLAAKNLGGKVGGGKPPLTLLSSTQP